MSVVCIQHKEVTALSSEKGSKHSPHIDNIFLTFLFYHKNTTFGLDVNNTKLFTLRMQVTR